MKALARGVIALALVLAAKSARAESPSAVAAEVLFREGRALMDEGKFDAACERFSRSQQVDPAVGTLLNLGDCYKHLGKTATARDTFIDAQKLAAERGDTRRVDLAKSELRQLEPVLARLRIETSGSVPGLTILVNGKPVDAGEEPMSLDPGEVVVEASAPGRKSWYSTMQLGAATTETVTVPALRYIRAPKSGVATGLEIGGGIALAASVTFGVLAYSRWSGVEEVCPDWHCPDERTFREQEAANRNAHTLFDIATASAVVGIVALGAGLYIDLASSKPKRLAIGIEGTTVALRARWP